jgi:hypothetical protein
MIRFKIEIETEFSQFALKKEYHRACDVIRALKMIDFKKWAKFEYPMIRILILNNDKIIERIISSQLFY